MEQINNRTIWYFVLFLIGILIGSIITCFFASMAVERRDSLIISIYHGLEGVRSLQSEQAGDILNAYVHQENMIVVMERNKEVLGLDLVPWSIFSPITSAAQSLIVPTPNNHWSEAAIQTQKNRLAKLLK